MGRRKTIRKPVRRQPLSRLDTSFDCPLCNHSKTCRVDMDKEQRVGRIRCQTCLEDYTTPVTHLSEPIDVYSDWIDALEEINN